MDLITKTVTVSETVIDKERAEALLKRKDCDEQDIEQLKVYVRHHPNILTTPEFAEWLRHHKEMILDMNKREMEKPQGDTSSTK